ncbi:MAG: succinate--CoA ligase subunit alpha [Thermoprotei archaeon]|nr:MAG: succinate--CoA ligase subunit alpha [Thermoprotei archaeon]
MTIIVNEKTKVLVQGITGREGRFHTERMLEYGTKIIAGVTPGKGGLTVHGVPVYNTVADALDKHPEINTSIVFVPAKFASDAIYEAMDAGIKNVVVITEGIPVHEELKFIKYARALGIIIVGPNTPGIIAPGKRVKVGIMPTKSFSPGPIGIVSRSGTLTYEIADVLSRVGFGQSTVIGIGGDPITGLDFIDVVSMFEEDPDTKGIVVIGEIGGDAEERLAEYVKKGKVSKPIIAYIAGKTAPPGKRMGHAGAIITMGRGSADSKIKALKDAGIEVATTPMQIAKIAKNVFGF